MGLRRDLLGTYLVMLGGLAAGIYAGVFLFDTTPAITGWLFGAGTGLAGGAAVLALASNTPLAGRVAASRGSHTTNAASDDPPTDDAGLAI